MTREEFLKALESPRMQRRGWRIDHARGIRDRWECCPLVAVARAHGLRRVDEDDAAYRLGVNCELATEIMWAADNQGKERLRRQMLRRLGLLEPRS